MLRTTLVYVNQGSTRYCANTARSQIIRTTEDRCREHQWHKRLQQPNMSAIAEHCLSNLHGMDYEHTKVLTQTSKYWDCIIKEAIEVRIRKPKLNRDNCYFLSKAWKPTSTQIKNETSSSLLTLRMVGGTDGTTSPVDTLWA